MYKIAVLILCMASSSYAMDTMPPVKRGSSGIELLTPREVQTTTLAMIATQLEENRKKIAQYNSTPEQEKYRILNLLATLQKKANSLITSSSDTQANALIESYQDYESALTEAMEQAPVCFEEILTSLNIISTTVAIAELDAINLNLSTLENKLSKKKSHHTVNEIDIAAIAIKQLLGHVKASLYLLEKNPSSEVVADVNCLINDYSLQQPYLEAAC
jgi:hypothetical protein